MPRFQFWLPTEGNLTRVQRQAIDSSEPIFLSGVPGTGKTVVSIKRLQNASSMGKKGIIFTYGKLLRKTIEEKLDNNPKMPVDNIHNWMWNAQGNGQRRFFDIMTKDENIASTVQLLKSQGITYDEILVDEGLNLNINSLKTLPREVINLKRLEILNIKNNKYLELDSEQIGWLTELKNNGCNVIYDRYKFNLGE